ncbi:MAG TPA: ribulose-phosphate 3-epimerase [Pyrinomonadaceae bacterium]|nr:ribulose-phosphate 3-epimerase [Pyrinomonadaceae bacterium]
MYRIAPSILSANFVRLGEEIAAVEAGGATILHVDVMDGRFVPNITIGLPVVKSIRKSTSMTIDTHLMIVEPGNYAVQFVDAGADMVSVHIEADPHVHRTLQGIRQAGAKAGVVINPGTPISALAEAIYHADFVLLMSVNPGFGGQRFIPRSIGRLKELRQMITERGLDVKIEIDGGIDLTNVAEVADAGAEIMVAGSAVFGTDDPAEAVRALTNKGAVWV